jgi:hypothetical protein
MRKSRQPLCDAAISANATAEAAKLLEPDRNLIFLNRLPASSAHGGRAVNIQRRLAWLEVEHSLPDP